VQAGWGFERIEIERFEVRIAIGRSRRRQRGPAGLGGGQALLDFCA
jgi:hypothetical protein